MKFVLISLLALLSFSVEAQRTDIDLKQSKIEWTGKKLGGEHYGNIQLSSGHLTFNKNKLVGGTFEMDMASITCVDITDDKSNKRLVDHLKSEDFFSVTRFPKSSFIITRVEYKSATEYLVTGDLTIKDKANPITFTAKINAMSTQTIAEAILVFDRSKYDVKFGSQSFFENLGDKLVYDDVDMTVKLVLLTK
ncbi:MAG TPA: YceI family protein [Cyclobacteriaceae bacterium]|nr:YceI family protein [Cyclobacteriaceae bacterium]HRF32433.1 YceI family protein [Cyclobacteriaceae bacterium]